MNLFSTARNFCALIAFAAPGFAAAQTVTVTQGLNFGQATLLDNGGQRQIAFQTNGSYTADSDYYFLDNPVIGHVVIDDYPPNVDLNVTFNPDPGTLTPSAGMGSFSVTDYFTIPATPHTDGAGHTAFDVGATLKSDGAGGGGHYNDTRFNAPITVRVESVP